MGTAQRVFVVVVRGGGATGSGPDRVLLTGSDVSHT